jgi:Tfp pilus assembly protein PilF
LLAGCSSGPSGDFRTALDAVKNKDFEKAESAARKVLARQPEYVPAYLLLAKIALVRKDEQSAELNYRTAYDMMRRRDFKLRAEDLDAAASEQKIQWQESAFYLADVEFKTMNYNRAETYYDAVIADMGSGDWKKKAMDDKQSVREMAGYRKKLDALRAQNYKRPDDPRIQADMAALFMDMASGLARLGKMKSVAEQVGLAGQFRTQARQALAGIHDTSPEVQLPQTEALLDYTESQENLMRGRFDLALEKALDACEKDPTSGKYHFTVASIMAVIGSKQNDPTYRLEDRLEYAKKAVDLEPKFWRYLTAYAGLLKDKGQPKEAMMYLLQARGTTKEPEIVSQIDAALAGIEKEQGGK